MSRHELGVLVFKSMGWRRSGRDCVEPTRSSSHPSAERAHDRARHNYPRGGIGRFQQARWGRVALVEGYGLAETAATIGRAAPAEPLGAWETQEWGYVLFRNNCAKSHTRIFSARVSPTHRWPNEEKRPNIEVRGRKIDSAERDRRRCNAAAPNAGTPRCDGYTPGSPVAPMGAVRERRPSSDSSTTERAPGPSPGPLDILRSLNGHLGVGGMPIRAKVHRAFCSASISRLISTAINPGKASATANRANVIIAIMINLPCGWARGDFPASWMAACRVTTLADVMAITK